MKCIAKRKVDRVSGSKENLPRTAIPFLSSFVRLDPGHCTLQSIHMLACKQGRFKCQ